MTEAIKVDGLAQFRRDLKTIDSDLPKTLRLALNKAADLVVADAQPKVPTISGRAKRSIRSKSTGTKVRVSGGGKRAPHYPWLDFGGRVGRSRSIQRPFMKKGRFIYRAYFDARDSGEFAKVLERELIDVARKAGIEVD